LKVMNSRNLSGPAAAVGAGGSGGGRDRGRALGSDRQGNLQGLLLAADSRSAVLLRVAAERFGRLAVM
jgi:hypothetical protein